MARPEPWNVLDRSWILMDTEGSTFGQLENTNSQIIPRSGPMRTRVFFTTRLPDQNL